MAEKDASTQESTFDPEELDAAFLDIPGIPDDEDEWEALAARAAEAVASAALLETAEFDESSVAGNPVPPQPIVSPGPPAVAGGGGLPKWLIVAGLLMIAVNGAGLVLVGLMLQKDVPQDNRSVDPLDQPSQPPTLPQADAPSESYEERQLRRAKQQISDGYVEDARTILESVLAEVPQLPTDLKVDVLFLLANAHRRLGNVDEAVRYSRLAAGELVEDMLPADLYLKARDFLDQGNPARARTFFFAMLARVDELEPDQRHLEKHAKLGIAECMRQLTRRASSYAHPDDQGDDAFSTLEEADS